MQDLIAGRRASHAHCNREMDEYTRLLGALWTSSANARFTDWFTRLFPMFASDLDAEPPAEPRG
jgi:alkanesulfonate monooxygenase SsuD/methylene tetrahydromethanopterin reductase-like flavin-dependent oxidoreductase (luciferase family)